MIHENAKVGRIEDVRYRKESARMIGLSYSNQSKHDYLIMLNNNNKRKLLMIEEN